MLMAFGSKSNIELMFFCIIFGIIDYAVGAAMWPSGDRY